MQKFITPYFFPAFIGVLGSIYIVVLAVGGERFVDHIAEFDSGEQAVGVGLFLLVTIMAAHMVKSLERPIASFFAGHRAGPHYLGRLRSLSLRNSGLAA